ncbi:MAG: carboxypeptidase regulatory-like domain-containing protein, partial [Chitinophagaceae bacterium]
MKKGLKLVFSGLCLIFSLLTHAQDLRSVKGTIQDTSNHAIAKVTVSLYYETPGDTLHVISGNDGQFSFNSVKNRPFFIKTTHLGFAPYVKLFIKEGQNIELEVIRLTPAIISLDEIIVTSPTIQIKEDTIEYKADSFKVKPNAMVEDLLKKLPGVSVDKDGNVTAQGKQVSKVRVNGKDFFQGDVKTATREINADMIDKVQIVDDYGDQANMSGIKDGEPDKVLNLQLKKDKNKGVFGRVTGGYGTDDRYQGSLNANYFNNNTQISVFGNSNNINTSVFNNDGNNNNGGPGVRMMVTGSGGGGGNSGGGGGGFSNGNNSLGGSDGIAIGNSIGTNFRTDFTGTHKGSLYGSYIFINRETDILRSTSQENIFQGSSLINNQNTTNNSLANIHRAQLNFEYNIDSFTYLKITPQVNIQDNNSTNQTIFDYLRDLTIKTSDGINRDTTLSHNPSMNVNALFNR